MQLPRRCLLECVVWGKKTFTLTHQCYIKPNGPTYTSHAIHLRIQTSHHLTYLFRAADNSNSNHFFFWLGFYTSNICKRATGIKSIALYVDGTEFLFMLRRTCMFNQKKVADESSDLNQWFNSQLPGISYWIINQSYTRKFSLTLFHFLQHWRAELIYCLH